SYGRFAGSWLGGSFREITGARCGGHAPAGSSFAITGRSFGDGREAPQKRDQVRDFAVAQREARHRRAQGFPVLPNPLGDGPRDLRVGPGADARGLVRRDVGPILAVAAEVGVVAREAELVVGDLLAAEDGLLLGFGIFARSGVLFASG